MRADGARPFVTFYDDATGERVELSAVTYANWVAKTANLVQDELDVSHGELVLIDLPTHWQGAVWLGAAWSVGLRVTTEPSRAAEADLIVCGPERVGDLGREASRVPVVALSLRPLGGRFTDPLPPGVIDYGAVALAQPDLFLPDQEPTGPDAAWDEPGRTSSQAELLAEAVEPSRVEAGGRLLCDVNPCGREGVACLIGPVVQRAGVVWVRHPDESVWSDRVAQERITQVWRG